MLSEKEAVRISKLLSLVLRHQPKAIGIALDEGGWVSVTELLNRLKQNGHTITHADLQQVVVTNSKKRFAFSDDGDRIRASQGHSVDVELGHQPNVPPTTLYHGTADKYVASILEKGLIKGSRQQVHLSRDTETAVAVGSRHGKPVVFVVDAEAMHKDGHSFHVSANSVWLTDAVPANYLRLMDGA